MLRAARAGGTVAAYVWDYAGRMELLRLFWDTAVELDPAAAPLDEGRRFPLCQSRQLARLWQETGLVEVETSGLELATPFIDFEDYWRPFLGGQGPAPAYVASLDARRRDALRDQLRARACLPAPTGESSWSLGPGPCAAGGPHHGLREHWIMLERRSTGRSSSYREVPYG
jgi:hypothetical protein